MASIVLRLGFMLGQPIFLAICSLFLVSGLAAAQIRDGIPPRLDIDEISKVMEKIPPFMTLVAGQDNANWSCDEIDLREYCNDLDGCTVVLHMQHKLDGNDMVRGIKEYLYFENAMTSNKKGAGLNGYTRQSAGGEHGWITGTSALYTLFAPWGWAGGYNYRPGFCPGQAGRNSPAFQNPYKVTIASHPHVSTAVIVED